MKLDVTKMDKRDGDKHDSYWANEGDITYLIAGVRLVADQLSILYVFAHAVNQALSSHKDLKGSKAIVVPRRTDDKERKIIGIKGIWITVVEGITLTVDDTTALEQREKIVAKQNAQVFA